MFAILSILNVPPWNRSLHISIDPLLLHLDSVHAKRELHPYTDELLCREDQRLLPAQPTREFGPVHLRYPSCDSRACLTRGNRHLSTRLDELAHLWWLIKELNCGIVVSLQERWEALEGEQYQILVGRGLESSLHPQNPLWIRQDADE